MMKTTMSSSTPSRNSSTVSIAQLLVLRSNWECLVSDYKLSDYNGTIDNLRWFVKYGVRSNRFRPNFDKALDLAKEIVNEANRYEETNLSSLHGQTQ